MASDELHPGVRRVLHEHGAGLLDTLAELKAPDLTSLLLAVAERRAADRSPTDLLAQHRRDRFVTPGAATGDALRRIAHVVLGSADGFEEVTLSPLVPLGLHSVLGGIGQSRVVPTARPVEVAADPTNALALEAASRRDAQATVRLKAVQRVTRAQLGSGPMTFAHFTLLGLVTAGRDQGNHDVEVEAMADHIRTHADAVARLGFPSTRVGVSDLGGAQPQPLRRLVDQLLDEGIDVTEWPAREAGTGYYPSLCFKLWATTPAGDEIEVSDGGVVPWTQALLGNKKERLMISGMGLDRLALTAG